MKTKVSIVRCEDYDRDRVYAAVAGAVQALGGISAFVKSGDKVLVKPNLLTERTPEEAVDTHPEVVRAVARLVREAGGSVIVGDSPGGFGKNIEKVHEISGMKKMAEEEGIELVKFTKSSSVNGFPVSRYCLDADKVISVPKFKTHTIAVITAGIKNMFGIIIGMAKAECHKAAPNSIRFAKFIAKVYSIRRPDLSVLDAVTSMEGDGPSTGDLRETKFIMASPDAVSMDAVLSYLIGIEPLSVPVTKEAHETGLGQADLDKIEVLAEGGVDAFKIKNFKLPKTQILRLVPNAILRTVTGLLKFRPKINPGICTKCNLCRLTCPVDAIEVKPSGYVINQKKCIKCLCCHEVCPYKAISIETSPLAALMWR